jgi:hypothetical protein
LKAKTCSTRNEDMLKEYSASLNVFFTGNIWDCKKTFNSNFDAFNRATSK